jgi:hypothetical protein
VTTGRRPRLLYLAFYFPPSLAGGVYRSRATANHFAGARPAGHRRDGCVVSIGLAVGPDQRTGDHVVRPLLLARRGHRAVTGLDLASVDRIVAADAQAMPLAWRLARRHPGVRVTNALEPAGGQRAA